jgi:capsular polysaccharide biosynthesis protein
MSPEERPESDFAQGGVLTAFILYPLLIAICAVVLAIAGVALGYARTPTYTSSSELLVGNLSTADPGAIPGAVGASLSLAEVYARLVDANDIQEQIARTTNGADASISATPVVGTPLIRVTATSESEDGAIAAANAGGNALADYVNALKSPGGDVSPIARKYKAAALVYAQQLNSFERLKDRFEEPLTADERLQLNEADSDLQTAKLKRDALAALYQRGQDIQVSQPSVNVFNTAKTASSDRASTMQITGVLGLIAGLAIGCALAVVRASRRRRPSGSTR